MMALAFSGRFGTQDMIFGTDLRDLEIAVQGGRATLYAMNGMNGGISRWQLPDHGGLPQLAGRQLHGQAGLRTGEFTLAEAGGALRLLQGGTSRDVLTYYRLDGGGRPGGQQQERLAGADAEGLGAVALLELAGGRTALYAAGLSGGGLQGWQLDADGAAGARTGAAGGAAAYRLDPAALLATVQTAGGPVLLAADDGGLRGYRADAVTGALTPGAVLGTAQGLSVSGVSALEGFTMGGTAWALIGAAGTGTLTLVQVDAAGGLRFEAQLQDTMQTRFGGISALEVVEADGHLLVLAAGNDGGLSLFTLTPGGELIHLQSLENMPGLGLQNVTALEAVVLGGALQVFAASGTEAGISRFTLPLAELGDVREAAAGAARLDGGSAGDLLDGGRGAPELYGRGGDDVLVAGAGGGGLTGGAGADIFVFTPGAAAVTVHDFTPGEDRIDLSLFEGLYFAGQLDARSRGDGIVLMAEGTRIFVAGPDGGRLELEDLFGPALRFDFPQRQGLGDTLPGGGFYGGAGRDRLNGTSGDDGISGLAANDTLSGGSGADTLWGGWGADRLWGGGGGDSADGGLGDDWLWGAAGQDSLWGRGGSDRLWGGTGADRLDGGAGRDLLDGGSGADRLRGGAGHDTLAGGEEADLLWGGAGNDVVYGGGGNDLCSGGAGDDRIFGGAGNDRLEGGWGSDRLEGGWGHDRLAGGWGGDRLEGGAGQDWLEGGRGADTLQGGAGQDTLAGDSGADVLAGGEGADVLRGGTSGDTLWGGSGSDTLLGGWGADMLAGGWGDDRLGGGFGADTLSGGRGNDRLSGEGGADVFIFAAAHGQDTIGGFAPGTDRIDLRPLALSGGIEALQISRQGDHTLIDTGAGSILLETLRPAALQADDFLF